MTLDEPTVLGQVVFDSPQGYTLAGRGGNTLTLDNSGIRATIAASGGPQTIDAAVVLADNLVVSGSGTLVFGDSSSITETGGGAPGGFPLVGAGRSLTMSGAGGTLILSGTNSYTGGTNADAGTLYVTDSQAIADGTSLTVGAGGTFIFDPSQAAAGRAVAAEDGSRATPAAGAAGHPVLRVTAVPEPAAAALLLAALSSAAGASALMLGRRFSKRRS